MKKKLLAVALAGLGTAFALPANAELKFSTKLYPAFVSFSGGQANDGKTATSTFSNDGSGDVDTEKVEAFNSWFRFSGEIDAGGGITGYFQIESDLDFDDASGTLGDRNSAVGLKGPFGRVFLGKWDTPFKQIHFPTNMFGISSGSPLSNSNLLSRTPYSGGDSDASFHRRQDNMVQYWSPNLNGLQFKVMWGTEESDTATRKRERKSASVEWERGPLYLAAAYEIHDDFRGASAAAGQESDPGDEDDTLPGNNGLSTSEDTGLALVVVYKIGKSTEIGAEFESLSYENDTGATGAVRKYERDAWRVGVEHKIGKWTLGLNFGIADEGDCELFGVAACSTSDFGATQFSIGGMYELAKNLSWFVWYTQIDNDDSASYSFLDNTPTGADPSAIAIGIYGRF